MSCEELKLTPKEQEDQKEKDLLRVVKRWQKTRGQDDMLRIYDMVKRQISHQARRYEGISGAELEDLMQEGFLALYPAMEHYREELGSFSSYFAICLKQSLSRYIQNTGRAIRIPCGMQTKIRKYQVMEQRGKLAGMEPADEDYMRALDMDSEALDYLRALIDVLQIFSVDYQAEDGPELAEQIPAPDDTESEAVDHVFHEELARTIWKEVDSCGKDQGKVIRMVYQEGKSRKECAEEMGVEISKVHSLFVGGMAKLRKPDVKKRLRKFTDDRIYSDGLQKPGGQSSFMRTRTSVTERAALLSIERGQTRQENEILRAFRKSIQKVGKSDRFDKNQLLFSTMKGKVSSRKAKSAGFLRR